MGINKKKTYEPHPQTAECIHPASQHDMQAQAQHAKGLAAMSDLASITVYIT